MPALDAKAQIVKNDYKNNRTPTKSYSDAMLYYRKHLNCEEFVGEQYKIAFDIFEDKFKKELFEGLVLGNAEPDDIEEVFGIHNEAADIYKELFFDTKTAFRTKLDLISYIENYPDKFGKELKLRAYSLGADFLYYTYAQVIPKSKSQHDLIKRIFLTSAYKAMAINFSGPNAKINKESMEFAKVMLKSYEALARWSDEDAGEDMDLLKILVKRTSALPASEQIIDVEEII